MNTSEELLQEISYFTMVTGKDFEIILVSFEGRLCKNKVSRET